MITLYVRAADGAITRPDNTPGRYCTADMIEAEALYLALCTRRTETPTEAIIKYPGGTEIPDGRFRLDRDWTRGPREQIDGRRPWQIDATPPAAPPPWLIRAACRYAKTEYGLVARQVAALIGQNDRTLRAYMANPATDGHRTIPIGLWWLMLIRLGLQSAAAPLPQKTEQ